MLFINLERYRKTSFDSNSSSSSEVDSSNENLSVIGEGSEETASIYDLNEDDDTQDQIAKIVNQKSPTRITLKLHVTPTTFSIWETVLNNNNNVLYVSIPEKLSHEASKQSFISLLEFAEEKLECTAVILCMRKDRNDRAAIVRTFLFLGFKVLNPNSDLAPAQAAAALHKHISIPKAKDDHLYLICQLED